MLDELTASEMLKNTAATATEFRDRFFSRFRPASLPPAPRRGAMTDRYSDDEPLRNRGVASEMPSRRQITAIVVVVELLIGEARPAVL